MPPPPLFRRPPGGVPLALLAVAALVTGCAGTAGAPPQPTSVAPDQGGGDASVSIVIRGRGFSPRVGADFNGRGGDAIDARFRVFVGDTPLDDVALRQDGTLGATIPPGLAPGTYDLTVVDPSGRAGTLVQAYRVVVPDPRASTVARFGIEVSGPQVAHSPFRVVITALDAAGAVATDFTGTARLSDLTGTAVPSALGPLVDGQWIGTVEVRATHAADVLTVAGPGGATGASAPFAVVAAPAAAIRFETPAPAARAGLCAGPITLSVRDAFGGATLAGAPLALAVAAKPASGFTLYADGRCAAPLGAPAIAAGAGTASFWIVATVAGPLELAASAPAVRGAVLTGAVTAGPPAALAFVTAPRTVQAGACSEVATVEVRDAWGNPSPAGGVGIALETSPQGGVAFSSDGCATPATAVAVAAGATTTNLWFVGTGARTVTVTASALELSPATQVETITAAPADRLAFTTAAQTVAAGDCSGVVTVEAQDAHGNPSPVSSTAPTSVALSAAGPTLYADPSCSGAPITSVSIPAAAAAAGFFFRGTAAGPAPITAGASGLRSATQTEAITAATPDRLAFTTAAQTVSAGDCSGAVTVQVQDAWGNTAAPAALPTTVSLAAPALTLYADAACATALLTSVTLPPGGTSATFHFRGTAAGPAPITAGASALRSATQTEAIVAATAIQLAFTSAPQQLVAGTCSAPVTLEARDAYGNPAAPSTGADTAVGLTTAGLAAYADAGCSAPVTTTAISTGATTARFHLLGTAAGTAAVAAAAAGLGSASQTEEILAAAARRLVFLTAPRSVPAGDCSGVVTVASRDAYGNPSPASRTATTTWVGEVAGLTLYDGACTQPRVGGVAAAAGETTVDLAFRGTAAGLYALAASAPGLTGATQDELIVPGAADHLAWAPIATPEYEGVAFAVTVSALDAFGNRAPWTGTADLTASAGTVTCETSCSGSGGAAFTDGQWTGTVSFPTSSAAPLGGVRLTATAPGLTGTSNAFDVAGPASRSPPIARFSTSIQVVTSGSAVDFDASASSDYQTAASALTVSWHFEAQDADLSTAIAPPASPWTAWSSAKTARHVYLNDTGAPIVFRPRLAVRDEPGAGGPDVGYAAGIVVVLPDANDVCVVDTDTLVDDSPGSTSCAVKGPDQRTSLAEALRIAGASSSTVNISFAGTRRIVAAGGTTLPVTRHVRIVAAPGAVVLDGVSLSISATNVLVSGLELTHLATPLTVTASGEAILEDLHVHDGDGIEVQGSARVFRPRMSGCAGAACIQANGSTARLAVGYGVLRGTGADVGVALDRCSSSTSIAATNAFVGASVLTGFGLAVRFGPLTSCRFPVVSNVTFDGNATAVGGATLGVVANSVFTRQTVSAIDPDACPLLNSRNLVWGNASDGCAGSGGSLVTADPLYVFAGVGDYRPQFTSPAKDSATSLSDLIDLDGPGPGLWLGAAPDRGGREAY